MNNKLPNVIYILSDEHRGHAMSHMGDENVKTPPSSIPINKGDEITIYRLDGMYCNGVNIQW